MTDLTSLAAQPTVSMPLTCTALEPISHGAGNAGNTQLLRTQDVVLPDGRRLAVPYVSGNSLRHSLRAGLAWHLCRTLDLDGGALSKRVIDLLWSGGALTTTGNQVDLGLNRRVMTHLHGLSAMGYSARSDIVAGTLYVDNLHLVCAENLWRLPAHLHNHPHAELSCAAMRSDSFGVRHDTASTPVERYLSTDPDQLLDLGAPLTTTQMIYDLETIRPGAVLVGGLHLQAPTRGHSAALAAALAEVAPLNSDGRRLISLGGKRGTGFGVCQLDIDLRPLGDVDDLTAAYTEHVTTHRDDIAALLTEVVG